MKKRVITNILKENLEKTFFIIPTLSAGGAEKVVLYLLKYIDRRKFSPVKLVLFEKKGEFLDEVPKDVEVISLKKGFHKYGLQWLIFMPLARILKKEKPDVIVSFMWYPNLIVSVAKLLSKARAKVILSERISLSFSFGFIGDLLRALGMRLFYRKADAIIVNSMAMIKELQERLQINKEKIKVIYNPVDIEKIELMSKEKVNHPWFREGIPVIIAIGRLTAQKGFNYLIDALRILADRGVNCRLCIIGEGEDREKLQDQAVRLGIQERVAFLGFQNNPYKYLSRASVFVLSSLYEGFPNALLEAMALGVPSVASRCPTGPEELITDGVNGILVPPADSKALAEAIERLILNEDLRKKLGSSAKKRAEEFDVKKIIREFERVLELA